MKHKRKPPNKNAACVEGKTAEKKLHSGSYQKDLITSTLKLQIGEILLLGDKQQKRFWTLIDVLLRQYVSLRISQNISYGYSDGNGAENSSRRAVR